MAVEIHACMEDANHVNAVGDDAVENDMGTGCIFAVSSADTPACNGRVATVMRSAVSTASGRCRDGLTACRRGGSMESGVSVDAAFLQIDHPHNHGAAGIERQVLKSPFCVEGAHSVVEWMGDDADASDYLCGAQ